MPKLFQHPYHCYSKPETLNPYDSLSLSSSPALLYHSFRRPSPSIMGTDHGLFVGLSYALCPAYPFLSAPPHAANKFKRFLVDHYGFLHQNCKVVTDEQGTPSAAEICGHLITMIANSSSGDRLVFYFCGYGSRSESTDNNSSGFVEYLCCGSIVGERETHIEGNFTFRTLVLNSLTITLILITVNSCFAILTVKLEFNSKFKDIIFLNYVCDFLFEGFLLNSIMFLLTIPYAILWTLFQRTDILH